MLEFIKQIAKEKTFPEMERFNTVWPPWGATGQPIWTQPALTGRRLGERKAETKPQ